MKYKKDMPTLPILEKEGYKFGAWYLDSEFKLEYNLEKMPKNDVHLSTINPIMLNKRPAHDAPSNKY